MKETVDANSIVGNFDGHGYSGVNAGDIIPAFTYNGGDYPGQGNQSILENGCKLPCEHVDHEGGNNCPPPTTVPPTTQPPTTLPPETTTIPPVTTTVPPVMTTTAPPVTTTAPPATTTTAPPLPAVTSPKAPQAPAAANLPAGTLAGSSLPLTGSTGWTIGLAIAGAWLILSGLAACLWVKRFGHR